MDLAALSKSVAYSVARDEMLQRTDSPWAQWWVVPSDDKQAARLNVIQHILRTVPYENIAPEPCAIPQRQRDAEYQPPPKARAL